MTECMNCGIEFTRENSSDERCSDCQLKDELFWGWFDKWVDEFKPIKNPFTPDAPYCGYVFDTHGPEGQFIWDSQRNDPHKVWTLLECDGNYEISEGWHLVNRQGHFITEVPW